MKLFALTSIALCVLGATTSQGGVLVPCYTEENIQYQVQKEGYANLNPDSEGKTKFDTPEECIEFCKTTYGQKAQFFTWREYGFCRCKEVNAGRQKAAGAISGNLWCDGTGSGDSGSGDYGNYGNGDYGTGYGCAFQCLSGVNPEPPGLAAGRQERMGEMGGDCIQAEWICDGILDCNNGEDEDNCGGSGSGNGGQCGGGFGFPAMNQMHISVPGGMVGCQCQCNCMANGGSGNGPSGSGDYGTGHGNYGTGSGDYGTGYGNTAQGRSDDIDVMNLFK